MFYMEDFYLPYIKNHEILISTQNMVLDIPFLL